VMCAAGQACPASAHADDPAIVLTMTGANRGQAEWSPTAIAQGPVEQVRIELKTKPVK